MDSAARTLTAPQVARALGVSLPTAHHALDGAGIPRTGRGHTRVVNAQIVDNLLSSRGKTPASTLRASELRVLAALSRSPLGQQSLRSVASKAGVSPTTASKVVARMIRSGAVEQRETKVASGKARSQMRWYAAPSRWTPELREAVRHTRLPARRATPTPLPRELHHLFWNADVSKLDPNVNGSYLADRLLRSPDVRAWQWVLTNVDRADIEIALNRRGMDERTRALVNNWRANAA